MKVYDTNPLRLPVTGYEPLLGESLAESAVQLPHIRAILVPVDFSPASAKALAYAGALARQFGAKINPLYVTQNRFCASEFAYLPVEDLACVEAIRNRLDAFARSTVAVEYLSESIVRDGVACDEIVKEAQELESDVIILSTHGRTGLRHMVVGSTAERVVRYAPCPVLVVREHEHEFI